MKLIVGISDLKTTDKKDDLLVTHSLGSCIGIALFDKIHHVGGMLHYMLPFAGASRSRPDFNPLMYGDVAIIMLFEEMYGKGAKKENIRITMAGGAAMDLGMKTDFFAIGNRNITVARKLFWKNNVLIDGEHVGGSISRTMYLDMTTGRSWIMSKGKEIVL